MTHQAASHDLALLPEHTRSHLRSTQLITSLVALVSELVQNSLDAGSNRIDVSLSVEDWRCSVRDDGCGIARESLAKLDSRYKSSKEYATSTSDSQSFGFRGEALASIADICCLEITSHPLRQAGTATLITKGGKTLYSGEAVRNSYDIKSSGTCVHVRDIFYNLPVRRKSHPSASRTHESIKNDIEAFALVFPSVEFSVISEADNDQKKTIVRIPKTGSTLTAFRRIFGRGLVQHTHELNESHSQYPGLRLNGFISLDGALSKAHQFIYVNKHPISYPQNNSELHRIIEDVFSRSCFSRNAYDETEEPTPGATITRKSPRKSAEKKPVFVLNLTVPQAEVDNGYEPGKDVVQFSKLDTVEQFLSEKIESVLERYGFISRHVPSQKRKASENPSPTKRVLERPFKRLKSSDKLPHQGLIIRGTNIGKQQLAEHPSPHDSRYVSWTDPRTEEVYYVDPRTGNSVQPDKQDSTQEQDVPVRDRRTLKLSTCYPMDSCENAITPAWILDALKANSVFRTTSEQIIPAITTNNGDLRSSFCKEDLITAAVISQVDRKFILCSIGNGKTLAVIDQHAADERVRVERFLSEYLNSTARVRTVDPPLQMVVSAWENKRLKYSGGRQALASWGFDVYAKDDVDSDQSTSEYEQISVSGVPEILADKLLQNKATELRTFIRSFLARREFMSHDVSPSSWLDEARKCPAELVELINSKACRGAIMFNDTLTLPQCRKLVNEALPNTHYPFICAHGRPSIAAIVDLRDEKRPAAREIDWSRMTSIGSA